MTSYHVQIVIAAVRDLAAAGALPAELTATPLEAGTTLDALGLDSMARLELLAELEERADVHIPESYLSGLRTLGDLAATLDVVRRAA
jgi:acyl carrier protein